VIALAGMIERSGHDLYAQLKHDDLLRKVSRQSLLKYDFSS